MKIVNSTLRTYNVTSDLGATDHYSLYACSCEGFGNTLILKIAKQKKHNGIIDREAMILKSMYLESELTQKEFQKIPGNEDKYLNYHYTFPNLIETFISKENDNRRISILDFSPICNELNELVPSSHIINRDNAHVDPRTSAWILGKSLKALAFAHNQNISLGDISLDKLLINKKEHYIAFFDWTAAKKSPVPLKKEVIRREISQIGQLVGILLGTDQSWSIPKHIQLEDSRYEDMLKKLCTMKFSDANKAHTSFYELVYDLWSRKFHVYDTY